MAGKRAVDERIARLIETFGFSDRHATVDSLLHLSLILSWILDKIQHVLEGGQSGSA